MSIFRADASVRTPKHWVSQVSLLEPYPEHMAVIEVGMGCFWGAERCFWTQEGVYVTSVGYAGGSMPDPDYRSVCSGATGHAEVVRVVYDPAVISTERILQIFWESHDPTQGNRQGNDRGTQYRSIVIYHSPEQEALAMSTKADYEAQLKKAGYGPVTTEIRAVGGAPYFLAEEYHQQYLAKNPNGYCGLGGTGVSCPMPAMES